MFGRKDTINAGFAVQQHCPIALMAFVKNVIFMRIETQKKI